jgi:hypothetical protein
VLHVNELLLSRAPLTVMPPELRAPLRQVGRAQHHPLDLLLRLPLCQLWTAEPRLGVVEVIP